MVSSISNDSNDIMAFLMQQMQQKMKTADTDGVTGLSQTELSSIDTSDDNGGAAFLKTLSEQFDTLDKNGDGQLSTEEISLASPMQSEPMGPPPGMSLDSNEDDSNPLTGSATTTTTTGNTENTISTDTDSAKSLMDKIVKAFLENFTESFDKEAKSKSAAEQKEMIKGVMAVGDTDQSGGLTVDELKAIDTKGNSEQASFINNIINNFSTYDTDGNGEISMDELQDKILTKDFSIHDIAKMAQEMKNSASSTDSISTKAGEFGNILGSSSAKFVDKLLYAYQNSGGISGLASAYSASI